MNDSYRVYGYRWVVLAVTMAVNITIQMLWIAYAPITSEAARYYHVSTLKVGPLLHGVHDRLHPAVAARRLAHRLQGLPLRRRPGRRS